MAHTIPASVESQHLQAHISDLRSSFNHATDALIRTSNTSLSLAEAIHELQKALGKLSGPIALPQKTEVEVTATCSKCPQAQDSEQTEADPRVPANEEALELVRDTIKDQDKEIMESWKDELNNLLVFAGLFSAVVTPFTIESYKWLQQDPEDVSIKLLSQVSLQLSRFTVSSAVAASNIPTFLNSTAPAASLSDVQSSFSLVSYAVPVNILWILSLTLSLLAAVFALTVQQWLRHLRLPPEIPVRRAVQLLAFRSDGLKTWQVASIISLLPLLLQIAVVLFLVGLFLLLQALNTTVTTAFSVVALAGLVAFLITVIIPLFSTHCPYKSPVVPTVLVVFQCLSYPLAVVVTPFVWLTSVVMTARASAYSVTDEASKYELYSFGCTGRRKRRHRREILADQAASVRHFYHNTLLSYVTSFGRHIFVDMGQFWISREHHCLISHPDNEERQAGFERSSIIRAFMSVSNSMHPKLLQLLRSYTWRSTFQDTVVFGLCTIRPGVIWDDVVPNVGMKSRIATYVRKCLASKHHFLLWQLLRQRDWEARRHVSHDDCNYLMVLYELDQAVTNTSQEFTKYLLKICSIQEMSQRLSTDDIVPACLLLDAVMQRKNGLLHDDTDAIYDFASKVYIQSCGMSENPNACQLLLVATALTLMAATTTAAAPSKQVTSTIDNLVAFLTKDATVISLQKMVKIYYEDTTRRSRSYPTYMSPDRIFAVLCEVTVGYTSMTCLTPAHLRALKRIPKFLSCICKVDKSAKERPEMTKASKSLTTLTRRITEARERVRHGDTEIVGKSVDTDDEESTDARNQQGGEKHEKHDRPKVM